MRHEGVEADGPFRIATLIPVFNRAATIGRAIESALSQVRRPDEIIVVDDGSTDASAAVAAEYSVRVIRKPHGGVASARNVGVAAATSPFVAFLDSDDFWYSEHLAAMERAIVATEGRASVYFADLALSVPRGGGTAWHDAQFSAQEPYELIEDGSEWVMLSHQPMMIEASVVRRDAYLSSGGSREDMICRSDTHLFFCLGLGQPLCAVPGLAGQWTLDDPGSITQRYRSTDLTYLSCTATLYDDLVFGWSVPAPYSAALKDRLAAARWDLARRTFSKHPVAGLRHLLAATRLDVLMPVRRTAALVRWELRRRSRRRILISRRPGQECDLQHVPECRRSGS